MIADEKAIGQAARIVKERDDLRRILGDRYDAGVEPYRALIREAVALYGTSEIAVALALGKAGMEAGRPLTVSYACAAACDVIEAGHSARTPPPPTSTGR